MHHNEYSDGAIKSGPDSPPKEGNCQKRKRRTMLDDQADLINLLISRSERARNFLHEGANKEQVLFATIAELHDCQLQTQLLETKLRLLQKEKGIKVDPSLPLPTSHSLASSKTAFSFDRQDAISPNDSLLDAQSTSTTSSGTKDSCPYSDKSTMRWSTDTSLQPFSQYPQQQYQQQQQQLQPQQPLSIDPSALVIPQQSKVLPVYRNFFHGADMPQAIVGPSFRFLDLNQSFLSCLPHYLYGPITLQQFMATGLSLMDLEPPSFYPGLFRMYNIVLEQGAIHIDGLVKSSSPFISIDISAWATFEPDPMSPKGRRIRYIHLLKRGEKRDPCLTTVEEIRRALIGQTDPLPLAPRPIAKA